MRDGGRLKEGRGTLKGERKGEKGRGRERKREEERGRKGQGFS